MRDSRIAALRQEVLADVGGEVLEIGFGTGLNLPHYPAHVRKITTVDPNPGMSRLSRRRLEASEITVDSTLISGEQLPFDAASFDHVVSTWTLCSIREVDQALGEIFRVLKPGGCFVFLEHGLSDDPKVQLWQRRLNPIQRRIGDGCRLDLDVATAVMAQPFEDVSWERFEMDRMPRTHGTFFRGVARK